MDELSEFCKRVKESVQHDSQLSVDEARKMVKQMNEFLYTKYEGIGKLAALGDSFDYFSDFHKYWERNYKIILDCKVDDSQCMRVAHALHSEFVRTEGRAFTSLYGTCYLSEEEVCRVRFLTANQDFRGSLSFSDLAEVYKADQSVFDEFNILEAPADFLRKIGVTNLSQNDKRELYAKTIAGFLIDKKCTPYSLLSYYRNDVQALKFDLTSTVGSGYGNKKADMFIRDMVVLGVWKNVHGFDAIDVASDVNTIKVALRTGIISTAIPLVSSFLDIFCYQYQYIDEMNAKAWRRVWEIWRESFPDECIESPCLMDYFVYQVIGKQFCKESLYAYECDKYGHHFMWHSGRNQTCQVCYKKGERRVKAHLVQRLLPCTHSEGKIAILKSDYVQGLSDDMKIEHCPFVDICEGKRLLQPPKSISIKGQTGWATAYSDKERVVEV